MKSNEFDRRKHVYRNDHFIEMVKDAVRFFNGTPVHALPPPEKFYGSGVYAIYYTGKWDAYKQYAEINRLAYNNPIYVGKAVPRGWRQARVSDEEMKQSSELFSRLKQHAQSLKGREGLNLDDFSCRFVIFEHESSAMIGTIEAALIKINKPLWNSCVDGFGNHDPGKGRYEQAKSDWDILHPGRKWADRLKGGGSDRDAIIARITTHLDLLNKKHENT